MFLPLQGKVAPAARPVTEGVFCHKETTQPPAVDISHERQDPPHIAPLAPLPGEKPVKHPLSVLQSSRPPDALGYFADRAPWDPPIRNTAPSTNPKLYQLPLLCTS